jgi:hypothetical protein
LLNAFTGGQLTSTERATLFGAEQGMEFSFRGFTIAAAWSRCSRRRGSEQTTKHGQHAEPPPPNSYLGRPAYHGEPVSLSHARDCSDRRNLSSNFPLGRPAFLIGGRS